MKRRLTILFAPIFIAAIFVSQLRAQEFGFAVYNADRLYDTLPSPFYDDDDYTPDGALGWTSERYGRKVALVAAALDSMAVPVVALRGVENAAVVRDIVAACKCEYSYLHRTVDSSDGLDFALLYYADMLFPLRVEADYGRLIVEADVLGERFAFIVCRNPRDAVGDVGLLRRRDPDVHIVASGDMRNVDFGAAGLTDATAALEREGRGNALVQNGWRMYDRIAADDSLEVEADVFSAAWLLDRTGAPAATYEGGRYRGGAGRQLPVCARIAVRRPQHR